jgi:flagellar biosynthetic protein FliO
MEWILVKMVLSLVAVVALMAGLALFVKKVFFSMHPSNTSQVNIDLVGHRTLAPKRSVYVLRVMGRLIVVGATEQGITLLSEWEEIPTECEGSRAGIPQVEQHRPSVPFLHALKKNLSVNGWNGVTQWIKTEGYVRHGE